MLAVVMPELCGRDGTDQFTYQSINLTSRLRSLLEAEHIAFGDHPVAEAGAAEVQRVALAIDEQWSTGANEAAVCCMGRDGKSQSDDQQERLESTSYRYLGSHCCTSKVLYTTNQDGPKIALWKPLRRRCSFSIWPGSSGRFWERCGRVGVPG